MKLLVSQMMQTIAGQLNKLGLLIIFTPSKRIWGLQMLGELGKHFGERCRWEGLREEERLAVLTDE